MTVRNPLDRPPDPERPTSVRTGLLCGMAAYGSWAIFPLYFKQVAGVPPVAVLAHRIVWSVVLLAILVWMRGLWRQVIDCFRSRTLLLMLVGLVLIAVAISVQSWTWAVPGLILLVVGAGAGLYGGFFYDVQGGPAGNQLHEVIEGKEYDFPGATSTRREQDVRRDVRERWLSDDE